MIIFNVFNGRKRIKNATKCDARVNNEPNDTATKMKSLENNPEITQL